MGEKTCQTEDAPCVIYNLPNATANELWGVDQCATSC